jgi:hypothetical protein
MVTSSTVRDGEPRLPAAAGVWGPASAYLEAIVDRDPARLARVLDGAASTRALIPPGLRKASGADQAASLILGWFADASAVEQRETDAAVIGSRTRLRYRLRIAEGNQVYDAEQVGYLTLNGDRIVAADLICSGISPYDSPEGRRLSSAGPRRRSSLPPGPP